MSWESFPKTYRAAEVDQILTAVGAGECVSVIGLSGAGKSNLLGFLAHRSHATPEGPAIRLALVDCNRLPDVAPQNLYALMNQALGEETAGAIPFEDLEANVARALKTGPQRLCFLIDRFDLFGEPADRTVAGNLRVLRDHHKYQLTYVLATRRPLAKDTELAELFYAHTLRLGPLAERDALWNIERYAERIGAIWEEQTAQALLEATWGYPSLLRSACEAHAAGATLDLHALAAHPAVRRRIEEFWSSDPEEEEIALAHLAGHPLLEISRRAPFDTTRFTATEKRLFDHLLAHAGQVCEKDDLIRAVWREDQVYVTGVRDDSLAQVVRRLRIKIEPDPSRPRYLETVPGRGYLFRKG